LYPGGDELTPANAWLRLDEIYGATNTTFAPEPGHFGKTWRSLMPESKPGANQWTDSYLAAFARHAGLTLVTFDPGLSRFRKTPLRIFE
jgi:predicted nucleic acid-binding protein